MAQYSGQGRGFSRLSLFPALPCCCYGASQRICHHIVIFERGLIINTTSKVDTYTQICVQTLPSAVARNRRKSEERNSSSPITEQQPDNNSDDDQPPPPLRDLMTSRVLGPVVNYAFLAFIEQCVSVLMPLVYATSIPYGGLGLSSFTIGIIMTALGMTIGISSAIFFPILLRNIGIYRLYRIALGCYFVNVVSYPTMNLLARRAGHVDGYVWTVIVIQLGCAVASVMTFSESQSFCVGDKKRMLRLFSRLLVYLF